jgi:S-adenosylmethionine-diacylglycerol 3-amino-3-carboxypropyl transferase
VYNTCWEDPKIDRQMMNINNDSSIVMITSAGCNALDYLLDSPAHIYAIDMNPKQNALLNLKLSVFRQGSFEQLFSMFGNGYYKPAKEFYYDSIRPILPPYATEFWDAKIKYFTNSKEKRSFYFCGTSGKFAWIFNQYFDKHRKMRTLIDRLLSCTSLDEQKEVYKEIEPKLMNKIVKWCMDRHLTMTMLGVPRPQRQILIDTYPGGIAGFLSDNLKHIFTELPVQDNYFWYLYLNGNYTRECCPNYLKEENFNFVQSHVDTITTHTTTMSDFLKNNPQEYSHYVLLDHQDWLASYNIAALEEEWKLILQNSTSGTKILMRSAGTSVDFFPDFVKEKVDFETKQTQKLHKLDRVGTYGSVYLATVR